MIQSVDRALRILFALQEERLLGVSELAKRLDLAKGTVHGLLRTLAARSMIEQDPASGKYMLGPALLVMGNIYLESHDLRVRSLRWATSLNQTTGLAVRVGVMVWPDVVVVHHVADPDASIPISELGLGLPAHATALGKAMLAFREDRHELLVERELVRLTGWTITDVAELERELAAVAESGIALERQEAVVGEGGVAGAVFDRSGAVVGAVSVVVGDGSRSEFPETLINAVRDTARGISREMGAASWPTF